MKPYARALGALFTLTIALTAIGPARADEVEHRFDRQQHRIDQGVSSGRLTHGEYVGDENRLRREERQRRRDLRRHDGTLTGRERARLNHQLNGSSEHIYDTKHNDNRR